MRSIKLERVGRVVQGKTFESKEGHYSPQLDSRERCGGCEGASHRAHLYGNIQCRIKQLPCTDEGITILHTLSVIDIT